MKTLPLWIGIVLALYVGFVGYVALRQDSFIFAPRATTDDEWKARIETLRADYVSIVADDGEVLEGMFLSDHSKKQRPTIIFFPGNAMLVEEIAPIFTRLPAMGFNVLLMDYRGYGLSTGKPNIAWMKRDAEKVFLAASQHPEVAHEHISVWGMSLGTGIAVHLASVMEVDKVILSAPFTSTVDLGARMFPIIPKMIIRKLLNQNMDTLAIAGSIKQPGLIFKAENDEEIPADHAERVAQAWGGEAKLIELKGQGHQDLLSSEEMWNETITFLRGTE